MKTLRFPIPILIALAVFSITAAAQQTFSVRPIKTSATSTPGTVIELDAEVTNLTNAPLRIRIEKKPNLLPDGWAASFCLVNCYSPDAMEAVDELDPNMVATLSLKFETNQIAANAQVDIRLSSVANPAEANTISFDASTLTSVSEKPALPRFLTVTQNFPNPFSLSSGGTSTIDFTLPRASNVSIRIYNLLGQEVRALLSEVRPAGASSVTWDGRDALGRNVQPGIYMYKITAAGSSLTRRMLVTR